MADPTSAPWEPLAAWIREAEASEPDVPDAMQVATVDARGRPTLRTVLLKFVSEAGLVFFTNTRSRKGQHLQAHPHAAALLHWKSLQRQVIAEGPVERISDAEADAYWASRPRGSQLAGWSSDQSAPLTDRSELLARVAEHAARFGDGPVPRPPHWHGYRLMPERLELWQGQPDRLHVRHVYEREGAGWRFSWVQP